MEQVGVGSFFFFFFPFSLLLDVHVVRFTVSTGVFQALRAVLVFWFSGKLFCDLESSQCFTLSKGISVVVVSLGVVAYSLSSKTPVREELPTFVGSKGLTPAISLDTKNLIFSA